MAKFVCDVCGYVYDEDLGDLEAAAILRPASSPEPSSRISPMILSVLCAA